MKNRVGSLQLTIVKEDGSENYLFQDSTLGQSPFHSGPEFNFYKRQNEGHSWQKIYKDGRNPYMEWSTFYGDMWEQPITLSGGLSIRDATIDTETRRSQYRREYNAVFDEVSIERVTTASTPTQGLMNSSAALAQLQAAEHRRQVEEQHILYSREMARRAAQREADRLREEEERNRPRRPWERMRDYFNR